MKMNTHVTLRFGDPTALTEHRDLAHQALPSRFITRHDDGETAQIAVAEHYIDGVILASGPQSLTVYGGSVVPAQFRSDDLETTGWRWATDALGKQAPPPMRQIGVVLVDLTDQDRPRFWKRLIWATALPRPMQRMDVALDSERAMQVRALLPVSTDSVDLRSYGAMIASTTDAGSSSQLLAAGWIDASNQPHPDERVWRPLHQLSDAMEAHPATLFGRPYVASVTLTGKRIDPIVAQTLPNDVLGALMDAFDHAA